MLQTTCGSIISHKLEHTSGGTVCFFMNLTTTNMYIMNTNLWKRHRTSDHPFIHLQFLNEMCKALT